MEREPWLLVQEGSKLYLLAQDPQNFIFIAVNKHLTAEAEEQLCRRTITVALLQEMGLTIRVLPKKQVRGIALTGSEAGETVYFYPKSGKKQKYILSDDYEQVWTDAFFAGMERFTPPGNQKKKKDAEAWRTERQDPALYRKMGWIPAILLALSLGGGIGYIVYRTWIWYLASLIGPLAAVVLDIVYPAYFTLIAEKGGKKKAHDLSLSLLAHGSLLVFMPKPNWVHDAMFGILWGICGVTAVLVMLLAEEFRRKKGYLFFVFLLAGLFAMVDVGHINQVFDFAEPRTYTLAVENLRYDNDDTDSWHCGVTLPDGREAEIEISRTFYESLEIGDEVHVELYPGALGIEYATAHPIE